MYSKIIDCQLKRKLNELIHLRNVNSVPSNIINTIGRVGDKFLNNQF